MRILYLLVFPLEGSGSGTYARELAREVAKRNTVAMVVPDKRKIPGVKMYPVNLPQNARIAFTGHPEWPGCDLFIKVKGEKLSRYYLTFFQAIIHAVQDFQPDIIHVHHILPLTWIARYIKMAYGIPFVVTAHGSELPTLQQDKRYIQLTTEALLKAARIVPNSFWTKEWMHQALGHEFQSHRTRVIPGGVDVNAYPDNIDLAQINKKYNLYPEWKLVLFSGKLTKYKGVKYLLQAAKKIDAIVGIAGDGPERENLQVQAQKLRLDNVRFFGFKEMQELAELYYRADVAVVPSIWDEPLGLVILEAMATKTPVVVTRKGGVSLAVKDGVNGFYVRPRNAQDIADKVNKLLKNDALREKLGENARKTIEEKFSWEQIALRFEHMYQEFGKPETFSTNTPIDRFFKELFGSA